MSTGHDITLMKVKRKSKNISQSIKNTGFGGMRSNLNISQSQHLRIRVYL